MQEQNHDIVHHLDLIERQFFSKQRGFMRDFGLLVFPFFTFFDALLDRMELDMKASYQKLYPWQRWWYRPKSAVIEQSIENFYQSIKQQWIGVQRDASEAFVERYDQLLKTLRELEAHLPSECEGIYEQLLINLSSASAIFFVIKSERWHDDALDHMGMILGEHAFAVLPLREHWQERLIRIHGGQYLQDMELLLQEERIRFHQALHGALLGIYQPVHDEMYHSWQEFSKKIRATSC
ncbi:hypothetical protein [Entomospira culicis]|uniref:Uncharacterized protein n=1 Tax=Entomospira culicis TaxID=2719989 RepID=A0A968KTV1_9SPIO|nr:hypothetical protein [Entomospira culicis]NIZ68839.1 hypothetical protein [Entomospira culicis]WDI37433.1 hypothetical protein PVA46_01195 [Entomospira culicis]WDI39061.1 hypothetical protein PVA47_01200 [Entomospira culicis]